MLNEHVEVTNEPIEAPLEKATRESLEREAVKAKTAWQNNMNQVFNAASYIETRLNALTTGSKLEITAQKPKTERDDHVIETNIPLNPNKAYSEEKNQTMKISVRWGGSVAVTVDPADSFQNLATFHGPSAAEEAVACVTSYAKQKKLIANKL